MAQFFLDFGYEPREELRFPAKKLRALWFSPPRMSHKDTGSGVHGPLPRIFISELLVDQMSPQAQVCLWNLLWLDDRLPLCASVLSLMILMHSSLSNFRFVFMNSCIVMLVSEVD